MVLTASWTSVQAGSPKARRFSPLVVGTSCPLTIFQVPWTGLSPDMLAKSVLKRTLLPVLAIGLPVQGLLGQASRYLLPRLSAVLSLGVQVTYSVAG